MAYLCGVLNSELLDLWYAVRGKTPRDIWRNYEPKPMNEMPYRHVPQTEAWAPSAEVDALVDAFASGDVDAALEAAALVRAAIGSPVGDADAVAAIEQLVRAIAGNRRALLPLRRIAPELRRAVKNPWRTHGVNVDRASVLTEMPPAAVRSVRLDPALTLSVITDGVLGRSRVPTSLDAFAAEVARRQDEIDDLLDVGRRLVEAIERLVCELYGVPDALTDLVVESAVARAGTVAQAED
ncbi:MAG: hypothetical protein M3401_06245 [Actinomycetota bacterium]|nr:hypothetical protein [Actinomycetota bacterium]